jgi:prevent-host-death family protein
MPRFARVERIPVHELSQRIDASVARVMDGESIEVTLSGRPVARIVPIAGTRELDDLVAAGTVTPATDHTPFTMPLAYGDPSISVADELARMRDEERY